MLFARLREGFDDGTLTDIGATVGSPLLMSSVVATVGSPLLLV